VVLKLPDWPPDLISEQLPLPPELEVLLEDELDEELLDDELLLLEDELDDELEELEELLLDDELDELSPTTPYGGTGWSFSQVLREIQLC
jgi:hypothetical protein